MNKNEIKEVKHKILRWFLIFSGVIQICYWGFGQIFYPGWYLQSIGMSSLAANPGEALIFINEVGILTIGFGVATILASFSPVKNVVIIVVLYTVASGSLLNSLYHILVKGVASGEWSTVIILSFQIIILTILYPWEELKKSH